MKRLLLTGSAGFAGSHFVEHVLANTDWHVVGIDSFRHRGDPLRVYQDPARYTVFHHDLAAPISDRLIEKLGPIDYLVNMASESHVDRSITDPVPFVTNNVALTLNVLEYARKAKPAKFCQVSTDEVYGPAPQGVNHKEWAPIIPSNPYSASKAAQEMLAISYWRTYGVPVFITNTMNLIGERQDTEKFIPKVIRAISRGEDVEIHGQPGNYGSRYYLHARNHADAILYLLRELRVDQYSDSLFAVKCDKPRRFNVVGEQEIDNLELAQRIAGCMGKAFTARSVDFHAARPGHDRRYALDGNALMDFGWKAPISFDESLARTVQWSLDHPEWLR